ncbi:hypothetical protein PC116_g26408 [Phytophthora cactorum]|uniref:Uncharacterized protein n=1 Tax=Phytophthora cactorum TaxID=29920 RepID=A0A8T1AJ31_9STRA|nr:hypothetical protein PC114_g24674 [Phytophthora cactorum]KAG2882319.1 hypothetical protein PC115_g21966 [Phytophthora cactorum]KAG2908501.1 hypothetical protein PC117_g19930 [Phytophthora cactorum]KAG2968432.1 hypothetical protein PC119_g24220 [Phytophthora cactorum]KAG3127838.1 hypothetical protein C6341_g24810 [Phytophthora cactorum]
MRVSKLVMAAETGIQEVGHIVEDTEDETSDVARYTGPTQHDPWSSDDAQFRAAKLQRGS